MLISGKIRAALDDLPQWVTQSSGAVFYSSQLAFSKPQKLYILGLNPGGDPADPMCSTVQENIRNWLQSTDPHSSYKDELWRGQTVGQHGLQPRMKHLFEDRLRLDLRDVPSSNLIFARSRDEARIGLSKSRLIEACWPVHRAVIDSLGIKIIVCLGRTAGDWACLMLAANEEFGSFEEDNRRKWKSRACRSLDGKVVVSLTHPSRADWKTESSDPWKLVQQALDR